MDTTDFIATLALITSVVSLTYTMVVDHRRPRLKVRGGIMHVVSRSPVCVDQSGPFFSIRATNVGPGRVNVTGVGLTHRCRLKRWYRRWIKRDAAEGAVLDALPESPNHLPMWLEVGESLVLFYPPESGMLDEHEMFDCLYIYDSLGGRHWAQKGVFHSARADFARTEERESVADR